jgi:hypothetical protein
MDGDITPDETVAGRSAGIRGAEIEIVPPLKQVALRRLGRRRNQRQSRCPS